MSSQKNFGCVTLITDSAKVLYQFYGKIKMMKTNMGLADKTVRILLAIAFAILYFTHTVTGGWGILVLIAGGVFLLTAVAGFCPLYALLGITTIRVKKTE